MSEYEKLTQRATESSERPFHNNSALGLIEQIMRSKAAELAYAGRYQEAEALTTALTREDDADPIILDLKARICAQQGRLLEAEAFWSRALRIDPANAAYRAGLKRIASIQSRAVSMISYRVPAVALAILLLVLSVFTVRNYFMSVRDTLLSDVRMEISRLMPGSQKSSRMENIPPDVRIAIPGVSLRADGNRLVLGFNSGLFDNGISLKPESGELLAALARQLRPYAQRITVHVVGHTDNVPVPANNKYSDNVSLGMKRAMVVAEYLRNTSGFPATMFIISSLGDYKAPYPQDKREDRKKNRTVELYMEELK